MKNSIFFTLFVFVSNLVLAQTSMTVNIAGIDVKTEKNMLPGDMISYWTGDAGEGYQNIRVRVKGEKDIEEFFSSLDTSPDENRHYTFNHQIVITESAKFSFDEELELLVYVETIFGNVIWGEVTRNKANLSDPIILDHYSKLQGRTTPAQSRLMLYYYFVGGNNDIEDQVKANGDGWANRSISDFRFMLKNVGDDEWKVDKVFESGQNVFRRNVKASIQFTGLCPIHLNQRIVMRVEMKTEKGNLLWHESELEARGLKKLYYSTNYTIVGEEDVTTSTSDVNTQVNGTNEDSEKVIEKVEDKGTSDQPVVQEVKINTNDLNKVTNEVKAESIVVATDQGAATDLTSKTVLATCGEMGAGDTLISMSGSQVCVRNMKPEGSKELVGVLAMDCNFQINGTIFPLKGNAKIKCNKSDGSVTEGVLRATTIFNSSAGAITLKEGTLVQFLGDKLIGGTLAAGAQLKVGDLAIECMANTSVDQDIRFDVQGRLVECTLAASLTIDGQVQLMFPKLSRIVYRNGELNRVICPEVTSFEFKGKTYNVQGDSKSPVYDFENGTVLSQVISGAGNTITIEGKEIKIEEGSKINFELNKGTFELVKFYTAEEVILNVQKGNSAKETTVKAGKKVVLSEGKVVKAG